MITPLTGDAGDRQMLIDVDIYLYFVDRALDGMAGIVAGLGDELANTVPDIPGANSPFALLTHCLGVMEYWAGSLVAGREVERDRPSEFLARGKVSQLLDRVPGAKTRFLADIGEAVPREPLTRAPDPSVQGPDTVLTQGGALQHIFEELAQHHGQMQVIRDVILAAAGRAQP